MPEQAPSTPPPHRRPGFLWFVLILIAVNWIAVLAFRPSTGEPRVRVPFNPFFLHTLQSGQVKSISTKGNTVEGTFTTKLRYPPNDSKATPTTRFATEIPTFWNGTELSAQLKEKGVQINASLSTPIPITTSRSAFADALNGSTWHQSAYSHSQACPG